MKQYSKAARNTLFALFVSTQIMGCINSGSTPQTIYYILDDTPQSSLSSPEDMTYQVLDTTPKTKQIKLLPVIVPNYLRQPNLVLKLANHQIKIANYHYWAQDLNRSIERILAKELNGASANTRFTQRCEKCDELIISIDHFYPTESGQVVLAGNYELISADDAHRFVNFSLSKPLEKGGYHEAVAAMRELLSEFALQFE